MAKRSDLLAEKRTHLAEIRTRLAYRRNMSADLRTSATLMLFGIAFIGFSEQRWDFFFNSGITAVSVGIIYMIAALRILIETSKKIRSVVNFFEHKINFRYKR